MRIEFRVGVTAVLLVMFGGAFAAEPQQCRLSPLPANVQLLHAIEDDLVDQLYTQVYHELVLFMVADPKTIERATWLLWVAHNLERIADRTTNICERVVFLVTGRMEELNVSKY